MDLYGRFALLLSPGVSPRGNIGFATSRPFLRLSADGKRWRTKSSVLIAPAGLDIQRVYINTFDLPAYWQLYKLSPDAYECSKSKLPDLLRMRTAPAYRLSKQRYGSSLSLERDDGRPLVPASRIVHQSP